MRRPSVAIISCRRFSHHFFPTKTRFVRSFLSSLLQQNQPINQSIPLKHLAPCRHSFVKQSLGGSLSDFLVFLLAPKSSFASSRCVQPVIIILLCLPNNPPRVRPTPLWAIYEPLANGRILLSRSPPFWKREC